MQVKQLFRHSLHLRIEEGVLWGSLSQELPEPLLGDFSV